MDKYLDRFSHIILKWFTNTSYAMLVVELVVFIILTFLSYLLYRYFVRSIKKQKIKTLKESVDFLERSIYISASLMNNWKSLQAEQEKHLSTLRTNLDEIKTELKAAKEDKE